MGVFVPSPPAKKKVTLEIWEESDNLGGIEKKWEEFDVFDHTPPIKKSILPDTLRQLGRI
jgi:hypothetical protein